MTRNRMVAAMAAASAAAAVELLAGTRWPGALGDALAGWSLLVAATIAWGRSRWALGPLVSGVCWFVGTLAGPLGAAHRAPVAWALLAFPHDRPRSRPVYAVVLIAVVASLPATADRDALTVTLAACIALAAIWQRAKSTGVERRARDGALVAALAYAAVLAGVAAVRLTGGDLGSAGVHLYESVVAVTALGLAVDLRRGTWAPSAVAGLVADLGTASSGGNLSDRLARALGDPDVKLFLRTTNGWMDADGAPLSPPRPGPGQIAASIDQDGEEVAVLIHDEVLKTQQGLLHGAAAAARLAVSNAQLETEVLGSVEEVRASRRRLVEAADEQRRRLEAELRGGAERELELAAATVDRVVERDPSLAAIANEIERAREDLRRFARGIHPAVLTQGGLRRALEDLVVGGSMAVRLEVDHERWPPPTEITAYFVCTEALTNVAKHA